MEISRHWRLREQRYALTGTSCPECGKTFFTPRPICDACNASVVDTYAFERGPVHRQAAVQEPAQR